MKFFLVMVWVLIQKSYHNFTRLETATFSHVYQLGCGGVRAGRFNGVVAGLKENYPLYQLEQMI